MNTVDEFGNIVQEDETIPGFQPLAAIGQIQKHLQVAQQLGNLHGQLSNVQINKKSVLTAIGLTALIGGAYLLNHRRDTNDEEFDDYDDRGDDDDD